MAACIRLDLTNFAEDMQAPGRKATARLVSRSVARANEAAAVQLAILEGTPTTKIQHSCLVDGEPVSFDETYLPMRIGEKVVTHDIKVEPIFLIKRTSYCADRQPVDYERPHYRGDQICRVLRLIRRTDARARQPWSAIS